MKKEIYIYIYRDIQDIPTWSLNISYILLISKYRYSCLESRPRSVLNPTTSSSQEWLAALLHGDDSVHGYIKNNIIKPTNEYNGHFLILRAVWSVIAIGKKQRKKRKNKLLSSSVGKLVGREICRERTLSYDQFIHTYKCSTIQIYTKINWTIAQRTCPNYQTEW